MGRNVEVDWCLEKSQNRVGGLCGLQRRRDALV